VAGRSTARFDLQRIFYWDSSSCRFRVGSCCYWLFISGFPIGIPEISIGFAKSSGSIVSPAASIVLWPYFAPLLGVIGLIYIFATARPAVAPASHPVVATIGWTALVVCFLAIVIVGISGATEAYIRTQVAEGIAGVPRGAPDENTPTRPQRPLVSPVRTLQPDQIRLLLQELPNIRPLLPSIILASTNENSETFGVSMGYQDVFSRSGITPQRQYLYPRGPQDQGILILVHDINNVPKAAEKLREVLEIANIHPKIVDGTTYVGDNSQIILFIAPAPVT
jgi:hypothetical protein